MKTIPAYNIAEFQFRLLERMADLSKESGENDFVVPIGLFLLLNEAYGGDRTAQEIEKRFELLNFESQNVIDFYFLGWLGPNQIRSDGKVSDKFQFDFNAFEECRRALRGVGLTQFGGNADLILVDAHYALGSITLKFAEAIRIDLSRSSAEKDFPTLGGFLQAIIDAADEVKHDAHSAASPVVYSISDKLGIAIAKQSILDFFLQKFGKIIGAKRLATLAVRNLAPTVNLLELHSTQRYG